MGAKRVKAEIRYEIEDVMSAMIEGHTKNGAIDTRRLVLSIEEHLRQHRPAVWSLLQDDAARIAIDSLISDKFRDGRISLTVKGRRVKVRETYRVPGEDGKMVAKAIEDLTEADSEYLENYYYREAMSRLVQARALRGIRQAVKSDSVQLGMG